MQTIVVKLGSKGSVVLHEGSAYSIEIDRVEAVDTTGAGDAYAGGFLFAYTRHWPPSACGALASSVAARTVAQVGAVVKDRSMLRSLVSRHSPSLAGAS